MYLTRISKYNFLNGHDELHNVLTNQQVDQSFDKWLCDRISFNNYNVVHNMIHEIKPLFDSLQINFDSV